MCRPPINFGTHRSMFKCIYVRKDACICTRSFAIYAEGICIGHETLNHLLPVNRIRIFPYSCHVALFTASTFSMALASRKWVNGGHQQAFPSARSHACGTTSTWFSVLNHTTWNGSMVIYEKKRLMSNQLICLYQPSI